MNPMLALLGIEMETIAIVGKCLGDSKMISRISTPKTVFQK